MEAQHSPQATSNVVTTQGRQKKLTKEEAEEYPKFNLPRAVNEADLDDDFFVTFELDLLATITRPDDIANCYIFAVQLDQQAKEKDLGAVCSLSVEGGVFEVVLKLTVASYPEKVGTPAANALKLLQEFLMSTTLLRAGPTGKPAKWKAKFNGTTLTDGRF